MRIYIDTANIEEIREIHALGFLDGVTTNPTLVAREKTDYHRRILDICELVQRPVSAEVISMDPAGMLEEARILADIHPRVVVKIPMSENGLRVISQLAGTSIQTNATLVFSPAQALLAARAGANYLSPFIGRIDDISNDVIQALNGIMQIMDQYMLETEVIAASIRHPMHVVECARAGAHIATVPYDVIKKMIHHPLTEAGIERFMSDWEKARL